MRHRSKAQQECGEVRVARGSDLTPASRPGGLRGGAYALKKTWRPNASTPVRQVPILSMADGDSLDP
jgi:hypothetical protein